MRSRRDKTVSRQLLCPVLDNYLGRQIGQALNIFLTRNVKYVECRAEKGQFLTRHSDALRKRMHGSSFELEECIFFEPLIQD